MKYFRRGNWFYSNQGEELKRLGEIQFQDSTNSLSPVSNQTGRIIGFFDMVDSTFKPTMEESYYSTAREMF